ncbi:MAG: YraN family protein [Candidatus Levybacteria bacterium]|nr:YraN family protein [Candidatus Levybacteria bacterium]
MHNKRSGAHGEDLACEYLKKNGYKVLERNFRTRNGEIDVIAIDTKTKPQTLVFIEVKTRQSQRFGDAFESVHYHKMQALTRTASYYKATHRNLPEQLRIDAIAVMIQADGALLTLEHLKNVS